MIGQGEGDRAPHPQVEALAALLIERGADPYDTQAPYNTSITRDDTAWLDFLWTRSVVRGRDAAWRSAASAVGIGARVPMGALDYLLGNAVAYNHLARAEWLIPHGADAAGIHAYSGRPLRQEPLLHGHAAMAALLHYGGPMGFAAHFGHRAVAELLAPLSRDILHLTSLGMTGAVDRTVTEDPGLVDTPDPKYGIRPLFALPDDEDEAAAVDELLLAYGADRTWRNARSADAGRSGAQARPS